MLLLYTFCCDIKKHNKSDLIKVFKLLLNSIHKNITNYKLLCFTNFKVKLQDNISKKFKVEYRNYYDKQKNKLYNNKWLNLSFNKINIYKDLYDEYKKDFCWIDLDTVICQDISYVNDLSNVFIENGGDCLNKNVLFSNNNNITVPRNNYIQGNFWKLDINLYNDLMVCLKKLIKQKLKLRYDLQDLFTYYIYIENNGGYRDINILGNTVKKDTLNGLAIWSKVGNTHSNKAGLKNLYFDNNQLRSLFYPEKNIHILSFTFQSLKQLYNLQEFKELFIC